jgi:hypothetical protein
MKKLLIILSASLILFFAVLVAIAARPEEKKLKLWEFRSIDTMKYSRDLSREKLNDQSFDVIIDDQVEKIAETGATHVVIATPYDEEFYPILERWVSSARKNNLKVWFRGNWAGWEGWFEYKKISRDEHLKKTQEFILNHGDLFEDGDIFTACPECENGGPGDPRHNGDVEGHRQFLIDEYAVTKSAFNQIGKEVLSNYNSMNGDVAKLVMDKPTTEALDGIVTIDHYVATPEKLISDINNLANSSGGKIVLGEFGAPIPDIHGQMTESEQATWIDEALFQLSLNPNVIGLNYWTNTGSSTELWNRNGTSRKSADVVTYFYNVKPVEISVKNEAGRTIKDAEITLNGQTYTANENGYFYVPFLNRKSNMEISSPGYIPLNTELKDENIIILEKQHENMFFKLQKLFNNFL